jgi:hypothetical protein
VSFSSFLDGRTAAEHRAQVKVACRVAIAPMLHEILEKENKKKGLNSG